MTGYILQRAFPDCTEQGTDTNPCRTQIIYFIDLKYRINFI